jgi:DNA-binding NarL/FixJ family response regulator
MQNNQLKTIPLIYYPSNVIFVDDNMNFLNSIQSIFKEDGNKYQYFNDTYEAESFLAQCNKFDLLQYLLEYKLDIAYDKKNINIDINRIKELKDEIINHGDITSVIIVDYDMPDKNGIEFFKNINSPNVFKVLLTGVADEKVAIDAFSHGIINAYIKKGDSDYIEKLVEVINQGKIQYFVNMCKSIADIIYKDSNRDYPQLHKEFTDYFWNLINCEKIEEFYIYDSTGSFLLLNKKLETKLLYTGKKDNAMYLAEEFAEQDCELYNDLLNYKKMCCYLENQDNLSKEEKINSIYVAQSIATNYVVSLIEC